jgi:enoyl-CoA hydratase/carnithine racemase
MEMLLTGDTIGAEEAVRLGLINRAVAADALEETTLELAGKVVSKSPLTLKIGKEAFYRQVEYGLVEAYAYTAQVMATNMLARDAEEGIDAFIEKRKPQWEGR